MNGYGHIQRNVTIALYKLLPLHLNRNEVDVLQQSIPEEYIETGFFTSRNEPKKGYNMMVTIAKYSNQIRQI